MPPPVPRESITIATADGQRLSARWWNGAQASERSVIFLSALAAPQEYLRWFAGHLATNGWGVLTFDYRSVGKSIDSTSDSAATLDDWVKLDIPAAVAEVRRRAKSDFLAVVAHSIGGQLIGQSSARFDVDAVLLIAAQRGIPKFFQGVARLRVLYAYSLFRLLIRSLGYLPVSKLTLPERCSGPALLQWINWGRSGVFTDMNGVNVETRFADFAGPLTAVAIADDGYAPAQAVEALTGLYAGAAVSRQTIVPQDYRVTSLGHFGFFDRRAPRNLWLDAEAWLRELEAHGRWRKARVAAG